MHKQKNIELIQSFFEQQANKDDTSLYEEFVSHNAVIHGPASGQIIRGLENIKRIDKDYIRSYPHKQFKIEEIYSIDDKVFVQWICHGSHKGSYKGIRPKNPKFAISGLSIYRISKGKITEIWQFWDRLGLLEQIGEISVWTHPIEPGYYFDLLKGLGMEKYLAQVPLLTKRERECLRCLLDGKTAKETAALLKISYRTVESYFENIKKKLDCIYKKDLFAAAQILDKLELL